ncbi:MAG: hypothetical protein SO064_09390 [Prevotella sp.]|nr:hypothetical protein [Prevotella sp.]
MPTLSEKNCIERDVSWMLFNRRILGEAQRTWGDGCCLLVVRKTTGRTGTTVRTGGCVQRPACTGPRIEMVVRLPVRQYLVSD